MTKFFFTKLLHEGVTTTIQPPPPKLFRAMERNEYNPVARLVLMRYKNYLQTTGITIITACRVSQTSMPPQHGKSTTFHQEYVMMSKAGVKQLFKAKHPKLHERKQNGWNNHSGRNSREVFKRLKQIFNPWQGALWSKVHVPIYDSAGIVTSWKTEFKSNALKNALL